MNENATSGQGVIWQVMILVLGWGLLYLPGLGTRELQGEEARRVLPGRTMLQTGDWVVPRSAGEIYNRKPPLVNWATAGAITLTGKMDEWTVRLPSVLVMLALALTVLLAGRPWLGKEGAFLAACICLTNVGYIGKGRLAEIEALYIGLFGMGLIVWLGAWWKQRAWLAWAGSMLILGAGFLAKGPVHLWYFYAIIIGVLRAEGRLKELLTLRHAAGLALFVSVWLPWALENSARNPQKDSGKVWLDQVTHRIGLVEFDWVNWLLQVPQSLFNFLPWAVLLPLAWSRVVTEQWPGMGRRGLWLKGLRGGLLAGFLVIALLPSSRPRFMMPLNMAAGLLVVECFALLPADQRRLWVTRWLLVLAAAGGVAGAGCLAGAGWFASEVALSWGWIALAAAGLAAACVWTLRLRREEQGTKTSLALAHLSVMGMGVALLGVTLAPVSTLRDDIRPFARTILSHTGASPALVLYKLEPRMWPFYLGLTCREVASLKELPAQARWVMVKAEDAEIRRKEMGRRYGEIVKEVEIREPVTGNAGGDGQRYVLMEFAGR
jgi:4-amino-4-deoxy-L-arabinose transferase-like glycosyltransferase